MPAQYWRIMSGSDGRDYSKYFLKHRIPGQAQYDGAVSRERCQVAQFTFAAHRQNALPTIVPGKNVNKIQVNN